MTKYLQLLGIIFAASAVTAEEAKAEATTTETAKEETVTAATEKKAEGMPAAHVDHVNRKAADDLSARLNAMAAPYAGPMAAIPEMPACCASKKPMATHAHKAAAAHKAAVKHEEKKAEHHEDAAKTSDAHKDAKHVDAKAHEEKKHDDKKEHHADKKEEKAADKK